MPTIAQTAELSTFERILQNHGLSVLLVVLLGLICWRVLPKLGERLGHWVNRVVEEVVEFIKKMSHNYDCLSENVKENTEVMRNMRDNLTASQDPKGDPKFNNHVFSTVNTNKALLHFCHAAREGCSNLPAEKRKQITPHLDAVEKLLS